MAYEKWSEVEKELKQIKEDLEKFKKIVKKQPGVIPAGYLTQFQITMRKIDHILDVFHKIAYALDILSTSKKFSRSVKNLEKKLSSQFKQIEKMRKDMEELFIGQI